MLKGYHGIMTARYGVLFYLMLHYDYSAANRLIDEVVQSRRRPLLGPSPG